MTHRALFLFIDYIMCYCYDFQFPINVLLLAKSVNPMKSILVIAWLDYQNKISPGEIRNTFNTVLSKPVSRTTTLSLQVIVNGVLSVIYDSCSDNKSAATFTIGPLVIRKLCVTHDASVMRLGISYPFFHSTIFVPTIFIVEIRVLLLSYVSFPRSFSRIL